MHKHLYQPHNPPYGHSETQALSHPKRILFKPELDDPSPQNQPLLINSNFLESTHGLKDPWPLPKQTPKNEKPYPPTIGVRILWNGEGNSHTKRGSRGQIEGFVLSSFFLLQKEKKNLFRRSPNATEYNWHHLRYPSVKSRNV